MSNVAVNTINSLNPPNPQSSIQEERAKNAFDPVKMNYFLEGSQQRSEQAKAMIQQMERDPVLSASPKYFDLTKDQQRALTVEKIHRLSQYLEVESPEEFQRRLSYVAVFDPQVNTRLNINLGLFLNCIRGNGTVDQYDFWANKKETGYIKGIYGCFGMTELAHGSNVAGLETTATFDEKTDEFIINTPHIGATKWWIGGAAHSSTHCAVYARLIVKGKDYGVKTFIVPLRDSNHNTYPGVTVGDIGAKMGRDGIDNGWIQFSSVRIPRYFMLQKYAKVSREGNVKLPPLEQLSYSALLGGRVSMALDSFRMSARIITIALRYAIARRQFKSSNGTDNLETQLLNYPLHQRRLLPLLATAYILSAGALKIEKVITDTIAELDAAVAAQDMSKIMQSINSMKSLFVDSGSLKSTSTWLTADLIDQSRQACGGHGYSSYNGFGRAYNDWVVQCTWEGDNNVLAMSVGKPIIRDVVKNVEKGEEITGTLSWLSNSKSSLGDAPILKTLDDLKDDKKILHAIEVVIIRSAYQAHKTIQENGGQFDVVGAEMVTLSKLRAHHYLIEEFLHRLDTIENKELLPYLQSIVQLYSASVVLDKFSGDFLAYGVLPTTLLSGLTSKHIPSLLKAVRPHVVALTDSFQYPDMIINSAIGNYDGNVYENYFKVVKESNPPYISKAPYSADLEAMLNRPALAERERFEKTPEVAKILFK